MNNYIVDDFIKEVVSALESENKDRKYNNDKKELDIPFIVSALSQHLNDKDFEPFINDIKTCSYNITYEDIPDAYYDYGKLNVCLFKEIIKDEDYDQEDLDYSYAIILCYDQRDWGYCDCTEEDKDYRKDKGCCGHGCDWWAPAFRIKKEISVGGRKSWDGDEHDFWEYEDKFYKSNEELEEEKKKRDKANKIKLLQDNITIMQKQLDDLLNT